MQINADPNTKHCHFIFDHYVGRPVWLGRSVSVEVCEISFIWLKMLHSPANCPLPFLSGRRDNGYPGRDRHLWHAQRQPGLSAAAARREQSLRCAGRLVRWASFPLRPPRGRGHPRGRRLHLRGCAGETAQPGWAGRGGCLQKSGRQVSRWGHQLLEMFNR